MWRPRNAAALTRAGCEMARRAVTSVSYASSAAAAETNPLPFDKIERKAESMVKRYAELVAKVNGPDVSQSELRGMHEEIGQIQPIAEKLEALRGLRAERDGAAELAASDAEDEDIRELAADEAHEIQSQIDDLKLSVARDLIPKPSAGIGASSLLLEIRSCAGGDEAALFAVDVMEMYRKFAESRRWKFDVLSEEVLGTGGLREVVIEVAGRDAYRLLRFESGTHRVQRIPKTETKGKLVSHSRPSSRGWRNTIIDDNGPIPAR